MVTVMVNLNLAFVNASAMKDFSAVKVVTHAEVLLQTSVLSMISFYLESSGHSTLELYVLAT